MSNIRQGLFFYLKGDDVLSADMQFYQKEIFEKLYTIGHPVMIGNFYREKA